MRAVGRPSISNPNSTAKIKSGKTEQLIGFNKEALVELILK
ncbi:hypothetical protein [Flavobacterium taihuense]|nr:hypothetical protein [Flavobacterium taihuense]